MPYRPELLGTLVGLMAADIGVSQTAFLPTLGLTGTILSVINLIKGNVDSLAPQTVLDLIAIATSLQSPC